MFRISGEKARKSGKNRLSFIFSLLVLAGISVAGENKGEKPGAPEKFMKFSGFTQVNYTYWEQGIDGFRIRRARVIAKGDVFKNINYKLQVETLKSPVLLEAMVDFAFKPYLALRIGQFKVPFSLENLTSSSSLDTINRSQTVEKLCPGRDTGALGRDIGAMLSGKFSSVEYSLALLNGSGINKADVNEKKDIGGRIVFHPWNFLQVGAAFYAGFHSPDLGMAPIKKEKAGLEVFFDRSPFSVKGEYIFGKDDQTAKRGWYVQAGYFLIPNKLQSLVKYDSYDKNREIAGDRSDLMTLGLNYFFTENTKFQINYELYRDESGNRSNSALLAQFQAGF